MTAGAGLRIGSLFSGYGGLDEGVLAAIGSGRVAWHVEFAPGPAKILAHRYPGIPNHVDVTTVDWAAVEPVDVLTGGFPCQDVSLAGSRAGLKAGTRSGLWSHFAAAIDALRPPLVVIENVRGLLSASAGDTEEFTDEEVSDLESGQGGVGGLGWNDRPVLRALGVVLGDLAKLGYDAGWCGLRAADAGAPHGRYRIFILAHPAGQPWSVGDGNDLHARRGAVEREQDAGASSDAHPRGETGDVGAGLSKGRPAGIRQRRPDYDGVQEPTADTGNDGLRGDTERDSEPQQPGLEASRRLHTDGRSVADTDSAGRGEHGGAVAVRAEHPAAEHGGATDRGGAASAADAGGERLGQHPGESSAEEAGQASGDFTDGNGRLRPPVDWGPYQPAVVRWEELIGREAPGPTRPDGRNGSHRLSPEFVEWMMGLADGHVTDPAIGISRNEQLKALGNGVVPQQAALAVSLLLERMRGMA